MLSGCKNKLIREGRAIALFVFFASALTACSNEVKADEHLVETFVELRLLDISYGGDSPTARMSRQEVLKNAGYTREQYLDKISYVLNTPEQWIPFEKAVNDRIDTLLAVRKMAETKPAPPKTPPKTRKGSIGDD